MIYHVKKHPAPDTLATVFQWGGSEPVLPSGFERMTPDEYKAWESAEIAAGWAPETTGTPVPDSVTRRQLFLWLNNGLGITRTQIRAMLTTEAALIEFDESPEIHRNHPLVAQLAAALSLTAADVDAGFRAAAQL